VDRGTIFEANPSDYAPLLIGERCERIPDDDRFIASLQRHVGVARVADAPTTVPYRGSVPWIPLTSCLRRLANEHPSTESEGGTAFIPGPLPRQVQLTPRTIAALARAENALGRLQGSVGRMVNHYLIHTSAQALLGRGRAVAPAGYAAGGTLGAMPVPSTNSSPFG
jgi:hypothetical protein